MKRGNVHRGINLLLAAMLLTLGLYPVGAISAHGLQFLSAEERAAQAETTGSIRYVKPEGSTTGECQSWDTACDLQTALAAATSGDELWVAEGIYTPGASGVVTATFQLKDGVEIYGGFAGDESALGQRNLTANPTILSGDIDQNDVTKSGVVTNTAQINGANAYHVVSASGITTTALLDGFTITAGDANSSTSPGERGGGMYAVNSKITIRNVTFSGNSASYGGGMYNDGSSPSLTNAILWGNSAGYGGGMYNSNGSPTLTNVTIVNNFAFSNGDGMYNSNSSITLTNVIMCGNGVEQFYNEASTLVATYSEIQIMAGYVYPGAGNIDIYPYFVGDGDLHLRTISRAGIDAGNNAAPGLVGVTTDLDGNPRFVDVPGVADTGSGRAPIVDMGAYEHPYVPAPIFLPLLAWH